MGLAARIPGDHRIVKVTVVDGETIQTHVDALVAAGTVVMPPRWAAELDGIEFLPAASDYTFDDGVNADKITVASTGAGRQLISGRAAQCRLYGVGIAVTMILYPDTDI